MIHTIALDLARGHDPIPRRGKAWFLVSWNEQVLGEFTVDDVDLNDANAVDSLAVRHFAAQIHARTVAGLGYESPEETTQDITLVVRVEDRPGLLTGCLAAIRALDPQPLEVILMGDEPPERRGDSDRLRFVPSSGDPAADLEEGWRSANGSIVAYLDERSRPDPRFVASVARTLAEPSFAAVTCLVAPAEFASHPQFTFDQAGPLPKRDFQIRLWSSADQGFDPTAVHPRVNGAIAYSRSLLAEAGGFPSRSHPTARRLAEYSMLQSLIDRGHVIVHDPDIVMWHVHPRTRPEVLQWVRDESRDRNDWLSDRSVKGVNLSLLRDQTCALLRGLRHGRFFDIRVSVAGAMSSATGLWRRSRTRARP